MKKKNLNTIIDRLLSKSGYNQNTASAEDFEDVYQDMEYKRERFKEYKQALEEIKGIASRLRTKTDYKSEQKVNQDLDKILQKCEVVEDEQ